MPKTNGRFLGRSGFPWRSSLGVGLILGLLLPILVLAAVSWISLQQRADARRRLVEERYTAVADLASTKLNEEMAAWHQELLGAIDGDDWSEQAVVRRLHEADQKFGLLRPLVMMATEGQVVYPIRVRASNKPGAALEFGLGPLGPPEGTFSWLMSRAQTAELESSNVVAATGMYRRAAGAAPSIHERVRALNGLARAQLRTGAYDKAADTYERVIGLADPLDARMGRWAVIARMQLAEVETRRGRSEAACEARFSTLEFLQTHRFDLDPDVYTFYRGEIEKALLQHEMDTSQRKQLNKLLEIEPELEEIDASLRGLVGQVPQLIAASSADWSLITPVADEIDTPVEDSGGDAERVSSKWTISTINVQQDGSGPTVLSQRQGTDWLLARRWRPSSVKKLLWWLVESDGPWANHGIGMLDPSGNLFFTSTEFAPTEQVAARLSIAALPGWGIIAYPIDGSLAAEARQDVMDYAVLLGAAFLAVVASLMLATRTLSREVALARTRSDFVSNVSHELKTPLALIRMFAENLRAGWVPEHKKPEYYDVMLGESERLSNVIDNVLDFSRIESGRRDYQFRATDLNELITDLVDRYRYSFETSGIELTTALPEEPVEARVDREGIAQVIVNLLSNAAKYIGEGRQQVAVTLTEDDAAAVIAVADTGVGISNDSMEEIFSPFCRIDDPAVGSVAGSGIGLTIVKHIVDAHGGRIEVESSAGTGSTFRVVLPKRSRQSKAPASYPAAPTPVSGDAVSGDAVSGGAVSGDGDGA